MNRQPYLPKFANFSYVIGAFLLKERPDICAVIGKCIAIWSHVDNEMGNLFSLLLGTHSDAALEVFLSLRKSNKQIEALKAAAKYALNSEKLLCFEAVMRAYKLLESQRNCLAHGCFGFCEENPEIIFWIALDDYVHFQVEVLSKESKGEFSEDRHTRLKEKLYVYRLSDLEFLYNEMEEFWWAIFYFNGFLRDPEDIGRAEEFRKLCDFPQIQREISYLKKPNEK